MDNLDRQNDQSSETPAVEPESTEVNTQQVLTTLKTALISGHDVREAIHAACDAHQKIEDPNEAAQFIADVANTCDGYIGTIEFALTTYKGGQPYNPLYVALLRRIEESDRDPIELARASIRKGGYLGHYLPEAVDEIEAAFSKAQHVLESMDNPESERMLSRAQYERHRVPFEAAKPYRDAVAGLSLDSNANQVRVAQQEHVAALAAFQQAIALLQSSAAIDETNGHTLFENKTKNRIVALQMEGCLATAEECLAAFRALEASYRSIDTKAMRAGNERDLIKAISDTVDRIAQALALLGKSEESAAERKRFEEIKAEVAAMS